MSRPLRVLMVCPQFRPLVGGYERAAERLSLALAALGHRVTVVSERREPGWAAREQLDGVTLRRLRVSVRPGRHIITAVLALAVHLLVRGRGFDVFHVHQYGWAAAVSVVVGRIFRRPVVLKLTGTEYDSILVALRRSHFAGILEWLHRSVDACLASSDRVAEEAEQFGIPRGRIERIPNGVDTHRLRPVHGEGRTVLRKRLGVDGKTVVLYVGRLSQEKNPLSLVEAWRQLGVLDAATLVIVGDGPERGELEARVECCGGSIRLVGFVSDPLDWYQAADCFVLPSIREGLSNSLLEALACGLPVVSTRVSGSEDIFAAADVGVLVDHHDASSLADGLRLLVFDPEMRRRCADEARRISVERFSLDRIVRDVEALYQRLVEGGEVRRRISG